jgi:tetratricopeptide (TPR) repeat protein
MSEKNIQVRMPSGKIYGPYTREEVIKFIRKKKLRGEEDIFVLGDGAWKKLAADTEFFDALQEHLAGTQIKGNLTGSREPVTAVDKDAQELPSMAEASEGANPTAIDNPADVWKIPQDTKRNVVLPSASSGSDFRVEQASQTDLRLEERSQTKQVSMSRKAPKKPLLLGLVVALIVIAALSMKSERSPGAQQKGPAQYSLASKSNYFFPLSFYLSKLQKRELQVPANLSSEKDMEYPYDLSLSTQLKELNPLLEASAKIRSNGTWMRIAWHLELVANIVDVADQELGEDLHRKSAAIVEALKAQQKLDPAFPAFLAIIQSLSQGQWSAALKSASGAKVFAPSYVNWLSDEIAWMAFWDKETAAAPNLIGGQDLGNEVGILSSDLRRLSLARSPSVISRARELLDVEPKSYTAWLSLALHQWKVRAAAVSQTQDFFLNLLSVSSLYPMAYQAMAWKLYGQFAALFGGGGPQEKALANFNTLIKLNVVANGAENSLWDLGSKDLDVERVITFVLKRLEKFPAGSLELAMLENLGLLRSQSRLPLLQVVYDAIFNKDWEKASLLIEDVLSIEPDNIDALGAKVWIEASRFRFDEAFDTFDKISANPKNQGQSLKYHALILVYGREYDSALAELRQFIKGTPNDSLAHYLTALAHFEMEKNHECVKSANLGRIHGRGPIRFRSELLFYRCRILAGLALDQAKTELHRLYEVDRDNPLLAYEYIYGLFEADEKEKAFAEAEAAIKRMPSAYKLKVLLGDLYLKSNRYDEAVLFYNDAKKTKPKATETSIKIAEVFEKLEKYEQAAQNYMSAAALDPDYPELFLFAARAFRKARNFNKAADMYTEEMERRPDVLATFIEASEFLLEINRPSDVPKLFQKYSEDFRSDPRVLTRLAQAYLAMQDYDNAIKTAELAKRIDPKIAEVYRVLGRIYDSQGQIDSAREQFEQYLLLMPLAGDADAIRLRLNSPPYK